MEQSPRVAVVGAGLAGLTLARILQLHGVLVDVYEADVSADARSQGGVLNINADSGQVALAAAELLDKFWQRVHTDGQQTRVYGADGILRYADMPSVAGVAPEIDRGELRSLLLASLQPDSVHWNHRVARVSRQADGRIWINFEDGLEITADLVVGADGAWSKVRHFVTSRRPRYTGVTLIESRLEDAPRQHAAALATIGAGSLFAMGGQQLIAAHNTQDAWVAAGLRVPEGWAQHGGIDWQDPAAARRGVLAHFDGWAEPLRNLVACSTSRLTPRPIYAMPVRTRWRSRPGVTLIGDAAHVMTPFAGEGANMAMLDAARLAEALTQPHVRWDRAVARAERSMFQRAWKPALISLLSLAMFFGPEAADTAAVAFAGVAAGPLTGARRLLGHIRDYVRFHLTAATH